MNIINKILKRYADGWVYAFRIIGFGCFIQLLAMPAMMVSAYISYNSLDEYRWVMLVFVLLYMPFAIELACRRSKNFLYVLGSDGNDQEKQNTQQADAGLADPISGPP